MHIVPVSKKRILIVSRSLPVQNSNGSATHMNGVIDCLNYYGFDVAYLYLGNANINDFQLLPNIQYFGISEFSATRDFDDLPNNTEVKNFVESICHYNPEVVIADYTWMAELFTKLPVGYNPQKLLFVHDLRTRIIPGLKLMGFTSSVNDWTEAKESNLIRLADAALVLQDEDENFVKRMAPAVIPVRIGIDCKPRFCNPINEINGRCLYLGSNVSENLYAVAWLFNHVWPKVKNFCPEASLMICGGICQSISRLFKETSEMEKYFRQYDIISAGRVDNLFQVYEQCSISLIPHWMNGGIKLKLVESLAHGRAVVGSTCGLDGINSVIGRCGLTGDTPDEFVNSVVQLLKDYSLRHRMHYTAMSIAIEELNQKKAYGKMVEFLKKL